MEICWPTCAGRGHMFEGAGPSTYSSAGGKGAVADMGSICFHSYTDILLSPLTEGVVAVLAGRGVPTPSARGRWPTVAEIRRVLDEFPRRHYRRVYRPKPYPDS